MAFIIPPGWRRTEARCANAPTAEKLEDSAYGLDERHKRFLYQHAMAEKPGGMAGRITEEVVKLAV